VGVVLFFADLSGNRRVIQAARGRSKLLERAALHVVEVIGKLRHALSARGTFLIAEQRYE